MPELLKNYYNKELVSRIAEAIERENDLFKKDRFIDSVFDEHWEKRELKQRMRHITHCLHQFLPENYLEALQILSKVAPTFSGFIAMVFPDFVEVYGLNNIDESLKALELFTQYSSSEFAIRPFIMKEKEKVMKQMLKWSSHKSEHVRRLSSEGCRPRLPWAVALPEFKKNPSLILPILENLKADESLYVRKSVANNLNDIGKDNPEILLGIMKSWKGKDANTDWIIKHASRSLLKKGLSDALTHFDFHPAEKVELSGLSTDRESLRIGEECSFSFDLKVGSVEDQKLRLEFGVYYVKANGKTSRKIFQITENVFSPGHGYSFRKKIAFKDLTTRKHYPGIHRIVVVLNGKEMASIEVNVKK